MLGIVLILRHPINVLAIVPRGLHRNNISILQSVCFCHQPGLFDVSDQPVSNTTDDMRSHQAPDVQEEPKFELVQRFGVFSSFFFWVPHKASG